MFTVNCIWRTAVRLDVYYLGSHCWLWGGWGFEALQTPCGSYWGVPTGVK